MLIERVDDRMNMLLNLIQMVVPFSKFPLLALSLTTSVVSALELRGIGDLPGGSYQSEARAISKNGEYIVGQSNSSLGREGFLYDVLTGTIESVPDLAGGDFRTVCYGVADSGRAVGMSFSSNGPEAFYRDPGSATIAMGDLAGGILRNGARGISMAQDRIVGRAYTQTGIEAFSWTKQDGMTSLKEVLGHPDASKALGLSPDGNFIIGVVDFSAARGGEGFVWSGDTGVERIGKLPSGGGRNYSSPRAVTNGARVIVGESNSQAFRWTPENGIEGLGFLKTISGEAQSHAADLSEDGQIVVGWSLSSLGNRKDLEETAFVWTEDTGIVALEAVLLANGLDTRGWFLRKASGINADGTMLVGEGVNPDGNTEGFLISGLTIENIRRVRPPDQADIVVEQDVTTGEADYGTGTGQSFLLPVGKTIAAIQLHIGSVGNGGGSIQVRLWRATGTPGTHFTREGTEPIASGVLNQDDVSGTPDWFTISLDKSFTNSGPDPVYLVFDIELITLGSDGWNDYSFSNANSYSGGHSVYWHGDQYTIRDGEDLTFRVLSEAPEEHRIPIPRVEFSFEPASPGRLASSEVLIQESVIGFEYTCFVSEDLSLPRYEWDEMWTEVGYGGPINWGFGYGRAPSSVFFIVEVKPIQ